MYDKIHKDARLICVRWACWNIIFVCVSALSKHCFSYTNNHIECWLKKVKNCRDTTNNKSETFFSLFSQSMFCFNSIHFDLNSLLNEYVWFTEIDHLSTVFESEIHTSFSKWRIYCAKSRQIYSWHRWMKSLSEQKIYYSHDKPVNLCISWNSRICHHFNGQKLLCSRNLKTD